MKLSIDTSDRNEIKVGVDDKVFTDNARTGSSQKLLAFIDEILKKEGYKLDETRDIKVNTGPGSFTGLRVGVSVAQALGWSLGVKVNGKDLQKGEIVSIKYK